jgi:hypothetical protein
MTRATRECVRPDGGRKTVRPAVADVQETVADRIDGAVDPGATGPRLARLVDVPGNHDRITGREVAKGSTCCR